MPRVPLKSRALLFACMQAAPTFAPNPVSENASQLTEENCVDCGFRVPGHRIRELAVLDRQDLSTRLPSAANLYDYGPVERLSVQSRPNTDQTLTMIESSPLLRAMHTNRIDFYRLRYLLPPKFRIAGAGQFQALIDDVMLRLAATPSGRKLMCAFAVDRAQDVANYFQVSPSVAFRIKEDCRGVKISENVRHRLKVMSQISPPLFPEPAVPFKKYVFIFSESGRPGVEAYTSKGNVSYLVLSRETMNPDHLLRTIAHELAISYDQLSRTAYMMDPNSWEQGIQLAFGNRFGDNQFEEKSRSEVQELKCAYRDPALKYAATAQRAFEFEDSVINDLSEISRSPAVAAKGTCGQILAKNSVLLQAIARAVSWETGEYEIHCGKLERDPKRRLHQLLTRIETLEKITLKEKKSGKAQRFCDLVLKPRLGPNELDIHSGGPRPRMGGWESNQISEAMKNALAGQELSSREMEMLSDALSFPDMNRLYGEEDLFERRLR